MRTVLVFYVLSLQMAVLDDGEINSIQLDKRNKQQIWESISSFGLSTDQYRRAFRCDCAASLGLRENRWKWAWDSHTHGAGPAVEAAD